MFHSIKHIIGVVLLATVTVIGLGSAAYADHDPPLKTERECLTDPVGRAWVKADPEATPMIHGGAVVDVANTPDDQSDDVNYDCIDTGFTTYNIGVTPSATVHVITNTGVRATLLSDWYRLLNGQYTYRG